jgi:hypothetical protein
VTEPISAWRGTAKRARELLLFADEVHKDCRNLATEYEKLQTGTWPARGSRLSERRLTLSRHLEGLESAVSEWLRDGWVDIRLSWRSPIDGPEVRLGGYKLFGALAVQMMLAVATSDGFAICSGCGALYSPKKRPRAGEDHYCGAPECKKLANRRAQERYRTGRSRPRAAART